MKTILETIATTNQWKFSYGRSDFHNLEDLEHDGYYLFCDPIKEDGNYSKSGLPTGKISYEGRMMILVKSDLDETYDGQREGKASDGKFEKHIKPMKSEDGPVKILENALICDYDIGIERWSLLEVINMFDTNYDGIIINFKLNRWF